MKKAVVTFITNKNEFLYPPVFDFAGVDFLCYTDLKDIKSQFWKICPLNGLTIEKIQGNSNKYLSQYEHVIFVEPDSVITKDSEGNIKVVGKPDISECFDLEYFNEVKSMTAKTQIAENAFDKFIQGDGNYPLKLTIGMLVGRKSPYFGECFTSIRKIMEAIPESELIIVDTGNEDGSVDKVRKVAEKSHDITIVPFVWIHNFAAARNEAVKRARGAWYMTIDDDEWFEDISAITDFFDTKNKLYKKYDYAMYTQRNYMDLEGKRYKEASIIRLAKNRPDLCYTGRIHENFNFKDRQLTPYAINSFVHHYGYIKDKESRKLKSQRNMALLAIENEEKPTDCHIIVQIVQEMMFTERFELAYVYALRGLSVQRIKPDFNIKALVSIFAVILRLVNKKEIWNYENDYARRIKLNYIEMAYVAYQYAFAAYEIVVELLGKTTDILQKDVCKYADKTIDYCECFEKAYTDYIGTSIDLRKAAESTVCENICDEERHMEILVIKALAYEKKRCIKELVATLKKINPGILKRFLSDYYRRVVCYDVATSEFYCANKDVPNIWMLFVQVLLQKPVFCAELLKYISTAELDRIVTEAQTSISSAEMEQYNQVFEELMILRLICEYMQIGDYNMAINAIKIALQGSEQTRAVALIFFEELKLLIG